LSSSPKGRQDAFDPKAGVGGFLCQARAASRPHHSSLVTPSRSARVDHQRRRDRSDVERFSRALDDTPQWFMNGLAASKPQPGLGIAQNFQNGAPVIAERLANFGSHPVRSRCRTAAGRCARECRRKRIELPAIRSSSSADNGTGAFADQNHAASVLSNRAGHARKSLRERRDAFNGLLQRSFVREEHVSHQRFDV